MKYTWTLFISCLIVSIATAQKIDRQSLVRRHNVNLYQYDTLASLTVGNGKFAFTVDITGLQTFPAQYKNGISLGTESDWGWHSFPNTENLKSEDALKTYAFNGKASSYMVQWNEVGLHKKAADWFRQNPHRLQLGNLGFRLIKKDGSIAGMDDLKNIHQQLDLWTGIIHSSFDLENENVQVTTLCDPKLDQVHVQIKSTLLKAGRIQLQLLFPYPTGSWNDEGQLYQTQKHNSAIVNQDAQNIGILHELDSTHYFVSMHWSSKATVQNELKHVFVITPAALLNDTWECSVLFDPAQNNTPKNMVNNFTIAKNNNVLAWNKYWETGAAIDFKGSTDPRAFEIERRVVLSQYLMHTQEAGYLPPQETGLTNNSWYGKPHLEMTWWHLAHYGLWNKTTPLNHILDWYQLVSDKAVAIAKRQGFEGARWQKMTDPQGAEVPSSVGAFLIWQQPHPIYFAEELYRAHPSKAILEKYKSLVFLTANFMRSFASWDSSTKTYVLGKGVIAAQERYKPEETFNPTYELVYWKWALQVAQQWRLRLGMSKDAGWQEVIDHIAALPIQDQKYLFTENATGSYTDPKLRTDHPSVLAALGVMPLTGQVNKNTMDATFNWIWKNWDWKDTWGWDFPMTAMTATRLGKPELAIEALLMPIKTNTYLPNGHNYQDSRLRLYLPGNGGLLTAIAMMVAGYDGATTKIPGIPQDGKWKVKYEGLNKMP
jgi:hypothetical protein